MMSRRHSATLDAPLLAARSQGEAEAGLPVSTAVTRARGGRWARLGLLAVLTVGGAGSSAVGVVAATLEPRQADQPYKLAILPFRSEVANPATDYLGAALAHEIALRLMSVQRLAVRPPQVVRKHLGTPVDLTRVAEEVDVTLVLTGSYARVGDRLTVTAELTDVARDETLWQGPLDVGIDELQVVARSVPGRVVEALELRLSAAERTQLRASMPGDSRAYEYYLRAISTDPVTTADWAARSQLLERSVAIDATFAPAMAALGNAYLQHAGLIGGRGPYYERAEEALRQALRLDPDQLRTLQLLASLDAKVGKSEESAELLQRALEIAPSSAAAYAGLGYVYRYAGLMDESIAAYREAQSLDASLANLVSTEGQITKSLIYQGTYDTALASQEAVNGYLEQMQRPRDEKQLFYEGVIHYYAKDFDGAAALFDASWDADDQSVWSTFGRAYAAAARDDVAQVLQITDRLESRTIVDGERRYRLAHFYALVGERDAALRNLEAAIESGFFNYPYISTDPLLESVRETPDFAALLERVEIRHTAFKQQYTRRPGSNN